MDAKLLLLLRLLLVLLRVCFGDMEAAVVLMLIVALLFMTADRDKAVCY
jgi:hypothetical protein